MTNYRLKKIIDRKEQEAKVKNLIAYSIMAKDPDKDKPIVNAYDLIKEEYMKGKYSDLTDRQLEIVFLKCKRQGRGGVCTTG